MTSLVELMRQLFLEVYCLSGKELIACCVAGTLGYHGLHRRCAQKRWWPVGSVLILLLWAAAVLWATVLGREAGVEKAFQMMPLHSYRELLMGGNPEILRSSFMNVLLFFPAGLLCAGLLSRRWPSGGKQAFAVLVFSLFSLGIELAQFGLGLGQGEIDDVLHNTLGVLLGFAGFFMGARTQS